MAPLDENETFPELDALREQLAAKHRKLLVWLTVGSIVAFVVGVVLVWLSQAPERLGYALPGAFLICLGILGVGRALVSKYTDYDTKDRAEFVGVADDAEPAPRKEDER